MRVLCIDATVKNPNCPKIFVQQDYTVDMFIKKGEFGAPADHYILSEVKYSPIDGLPCAYEASQFIPLTDGEDVSHEADAERFVQIYGRVSGKTFIQEYWKK